jgi:hypothetical protein
MGRRQSVLGHRVAEFSTNEGPSSARIGSAPTNAPTPQENTSTNALAADHPITGLTHVTSPKPEIRTPLVALEWESAIKAAGITHRYPQIPHFITYGANAGISSINSTFTPPNHPSISAHQKIFHEIVNNEFEKGHYWGPFSKEELEKIIGPFQTSPLSLIPKPGKPEKFRLIQNLSYPRNIEGIYSINLKIEMDLYPCTWGTFSTVATLTWSLPPGSMGACRDMAKAY